MQAPKIEIVRGHFTLAVALSQKHLVTAMEGIVEELVVLKDSLVKMLESSEALKPMISSDLDQEKVNLSTLKNLYTKHGTSQDGQKFYVTFNKSRALKTLAEKFFKDAEDLFGTPSAKALCPSVFSNLTNCKSNLGAMDMQSAKMAIANLTSLTSLFRPLNTGETRNVLTNKCLKGFVSMTLKPSKAFLQVLSQHATPDIYALFTKMYNDAAPKS